jgi:hypothetical protein
MNSETTYDLAFSFAGEDRDYVEKVKVECEKLGLTVYYDQDRRIEQWGKSFIGEQRKVYSGYKTKHFVPFISQHYFVKPVPTDEFKSALMESIRRSQYILPIKLDNSKVSIEYLSEDTQYLKSADYSPQQLAGALKYIVTSGKEPAKEVDALLDYELKLEGPKIVPRAYSKFEQAEELIKYIAEQFKKNLPTLHSEGFTTAVRGDDQKVWVMLERDGKTVFVLNVFFSNMGQNTLGYNFNERQMMANAESVNGLIEPEYDKQAKAPRFVLNSFFGVTKDDLKTKEDIVEYFWEEMNQKIEWASK